jgi:hypothetical protein
MKNKRQGPFCGSWCSQHTTEQGTWYTWELCIPELCRKRAEEAGRVGDSGKGSRFPPFRMGDAKPGHLWTLSGTQLDTEALLPRHTRGSLTWPPRKEPKFLYGKAWRAGGCLEKTWSVGWPGQCGSRALWKAEKWPQNDIHIQIPGTSLFFFFFAVLGVELRASPLSYTPQLWNV